jgi:hypothetical protein
MGSNDQPTTVSPQPQVEQVLRMKYHDMATLQKGLDNIYGPGQYRLKASKISATFLKHTTDCPLVSAGSVDSLCTAASN